MVAQSLGAQQPKQAYRLGWRSTLIATITLSTFGVIFFLYRFQLPQWFTTRIDLQLVASSALIVVACAQPFMAISVVLSQSLRGAGFTRQVMFVSVVSGFAVRLITTWFTTTQFHLGVRGVWLGSTTDWCIRSTILAVLWVKIRAHFFHENRSSKAASQTSFC